ncbi:hypothetical protein [Actinomadura sp. HBU206391]|uniref:hypothetical protein n=1 Tax=Actinomadura sp. HBU206391 TaxID=2731692 RepID=UPI00165055EA|nr:hypothetical protein [Actinomadura sp. HBU206391]MBC6456847.1 hypothetical protein [Actinomadura sp. HBU206391]
MAVQIWRDRRRHGADGDTRDAKPRSRPSGSGFVERRASRRERRHGHNPVSALIWLAAWAAALTLLAGMGLTWADANTGNTLVQNILDAGRWLATPFADVFTNPDPDKQMYANWGLAAAVYYVMGRILAWLIRR